MVRDDIAASRQGGLLPIRIRVFLEFLAERIKISDA
jgi:hypothetical protein